MIPSMMRIITSHKKLSASQFSMSADEDRPEPETPPSELSDVCELLASLLGPDEHAILRFQTKEGQRLDQIDSRLQEILGLLQEISVATEFGDPHELAVRLKTVLASVDSIADFVADVKKRLQQAADEIEKRKPNKLMKLFRKKNDAAPQTSLQSFLYDTDELMRAHNLAAPANQENV